MASVGSELSCPTINSERTCCTYIPNVLDIELSSGAEMMSARVEASCCVTHPSFVRTQLSGAGLITPRNWAATVSSLGSSSPAGAGWFPTITRGHGGIGWLAHTAATSTSARAAEVLIVPALLDPVGVVGCSSHPTTPNPTPNATTRATRIVAPGRDWIFIMRTRYFFGAIPGEAEGTSPFTMVTLKPSGACPPSAARESFTSSLTVE